MTRTRNPRPAGFTLIELLVVVSIIALLAAITAAAVVRVKATQQSKSNDMTVDKIQKAADQQWKAVVDECMATNTKRRMPDGLINLCQQDEKRARALWIYLNLRYEFPQSYAEANNSVSPGFAISLPARKTFTSIQNAGTADEQAAACLYAILIEKASGGAVSLSDDVIQSTVETPAGRAFRDAYGQPITFRRFYSGATELQAAPFINPKNASKDPIDVDNALRTWNTSYTIPGNPPQQTTYRQIMANWVGISDFDGQNRVITVISSGPNKVFENNPTGTTDDFWGYRLRRMGNKGD